jgi:hypothetical protein
MEAGIFRQRLESVASKDYRIKRDLVIHRSNHASDPNVPPAPGPPVPGDRLTRAFMADCDRPNSLANLTRYKAAIQLSLDRFLRQLKFYQPHKSVEPAGGNGQGHRKSLRLRLASIHGVL